MRICDWAFLIKVLRENFFKWMTYRMFVEVCLSPVGWLDSMIRGLGCACNPCGTLPLSRVSHHLEVLQCFFEISMGLLYLFYLKTVPFTEFSRCDFHLANFEPFEGKLRSARTTNHQSDVLVIWVKLLRWGWCFTFLQFHVLIFRHGVALCFYGGKNSLICLAVCSDGNVIGRCQGKRWSTIIPQKARGKACAPQGQWWVPSGSGCP